MTLGHFVKFTNFDLIFHIWSVPAYPTIKWIPALSSNWVGCYFWQITLQCKVHTSLIGVTCKRLKLESLFEVYPMSVLEIYRLSYINVTMQMRPRFLRCCFQLDFVLKLHRWLHHVAAQRFLTQVSTAPSRICINITPINQSFPCTLLECNL